MKKILEMRRIITAVLAIVMLLTVAGCGGTVKRPVIIDDDDEQIVSGRDPVTSTIGGSGDKDDSSDSSKNDGSNGSTSSSGRTMVKRKKQKAETPAAVRKPVEAYVKKVNGTPRLFINGEMTTGNLFFVNGDVTSSSSIYASEIGYASAGGMNIYSTIFNLNYTADLSLPEKIRYNGLNRILNTILDNDPDAYILLRVSVIASAEVIGDDATDDGANTGWVSYGSDKWEEETNKRLKDLVKYIQSVPEFAAAVYGYHLDCGEWFPRNFTAKTDISETNSRKFREWLKNKYKTDAALQAAWKTTKYTLATAKAPDDLPINAGGSRNILLSEGDQRFIDYNLYWSDLTAGRINGMAKAIKEQSNNKSVVIAFYGYYFEQYHATTGHWDFQTLLNSPYVDGFASPTSYMDRNGGKNAVIATSGYMTTVASVARAGKIWIMESDERTFINRTSKPQDTTSYPPLKSIDEINMVHKREMGIAMINGATMYPMDLAGVGWYDAEDIWVNFGRLDKAYLAYAKSQKKTSQFDVAIVVDEEASAHVGSAWNLSSPALAQTMLNAYRSGVSFALVEMSDVLNGKFNDCKTFIFTNPYAITDADVDKLVNILHKDNKTAIYMYSFGAMSSASMKKLTGMDMTTTNSSISHNITTEPQVKIKNMPKTINGSSGNPKTVCDSYTTLLGIYGDGSAGFALYEGKNYNTIFFGSNQLSSGLIREFARYSGANVFSESDDVIVANHNMIVLGAKTNGTKKLSFNKKVDVYDYFNDTWYRDVTSVTLKGFIKGDTSWLFYGDEAEIKAMNLPKWQEP